MRDDINLQLPEFYEQIDTATKSAEFTMASDVLTCALLRTLAASKPAGKFLELGTGTGLSTSWILDGMDVDSSLISVDNDPKFLDIANRFLAHDKRVELILSDGGEWITNNKHEVFDYIFADTWHGKYLMLNEALSMVAKGGLYIIDDMLPQPNWPDGHHEKALKLVDYLEKRNDFILTKQCWATGILIAVKK